VAYQHFAKEIETPTSPADVQRQWMLDWTPLLGNHGYGLISQQAGRLTYERRYRSDRDLGGLHPAVSYRLARAAGRERRATITVAIEPVETGSRVTIAGEAPAPMVQTFLELRPAAVEPAPAPNPS